MSRILTSLLIRLVFPAIFLAGPLWGQAPTEMPAAPVPTQIVSAKRAFIFNAGEETYFQLPKDAMYTGGPNRTYNQFYAAMKSWGRYELSYAPADADIVFEIGFSDRNQGPMFVSQIKLVVLDPKTHIGLWTLTKYVEPAGMAKNREKNYNIAMDALVEDLKNLASPTAATK
jgi:hypothetical protein